ncbi:MAG TPA: Holliday junction resolvase RuvX [Candidatus Krumholzibacteria bacterium]|nr:Holliday junction resolvase RuvX [Candidatus Krumholzibacteria bacterium]HRX50241.1 Holliday junction resolvase RuvX [Candidatus Krumholzibacteria bacterium]
MGSVLGLDYGTRRIGIAGSDPTRLIASALGCHREPEDGSVLARLRDLIRERDVDTVVVGLPLTADGRRGPIAERAERFAARLREEFGLPVVLVDERYSSQEADRWLAGRRRPKGERDAAAAALILQQFLDGAAGGGA